MRKSIFSRKEIRIQLLIFLGSGFAVYFVASFTDLFELIYEFVHKNEKYNFDELFIVLSSWTILLLIFAIKKTKALHKQNFITDALSKELKEEIRSRDELQAILAHDLKAPFSPIIGFSDLLIKKDSELETNTRLRYLGLINDAGRATYQLIENILDWSSLKSGKLIPSFEKVQLSDLIDNSVALLKASAMKKHIRIFSNVQDDIFVWVDEKMLRTVFRNLISNAIKFSESGSSINIVADVNSETVKVTVSDNGTGLSIAQIDKIFSNDIQSTSGTDKESGTGLGLVICKEFIEYNNSTLQIKSEVGVGSTFSFVLARKQAS